MESENIKAVELFKQGKFEESIEEFKKMIDEDGNNAEIYNNIGAAYANIGDLANAEKYFFETVKCNPHIAQAYINLADIFYKQQEFELAIDVLQSGSANCPNDVVIAHYLARIYMEDARLDIAIDELEKVLEKQPDNYDAYYDLGQVYFKLGNYEAAITNFENVLNYKENNEHIYFYLAQAYEANDELDKAISNYLKATTVNDKFHPAYKKLGVLFMARGDREDAIEYFEDYLKFDLPEEEKNNVSKLIERLKKD